MKKLVILLGFFLVFANLAFGSDLLEVAKLARECESGKVEACDKLAKLALTDKKVEVREAAAKRLSDQTVLTRLAKMDPQARVRLAAVKKLTDQNTLAEIAKKDGNYKVRWAAVRKLTDQALLAEIAQNDADSGVRLAAVRKLTDQAVLAGIVQNDADYDVRRAAVETLTDQSILAGIATNASEKDVQAAAIIKLEPIHEIVQRLGGDMCSMANEALECLCRLKLAIQDPCIQARFPNLGVRCSISYQTKEYRKGVGIKGGETVRIPGEIVCMELFQGDTIVADRSWVAQSAEFIVAIKHEIEGKSLISGGTQLAFVSVERLLDDLFCCNVFTQQELKDIVQSKVPEVRWAAVRKLTDQAILADIARADNVSEVRSEAKAHLKLLRGK